MRNAFLCSLVAVGLVYGISGGLDPAAEKARTESSRRGWKMVVGSMDGPQGRAAQLVNAEMGRFFVRDPGIYAIHTLPVVLADDPREIPGRNQILIGTLANNAHLARWVKPSDIPENGYVVWAFEQDGAKMVVIAGDNPASVLYSAVDFAEDGPRVTVRTPDRDVLIPIRIDGFGEKPFYGVVRDGAWAHDFGKEPTGAVSVSNLANANDERRNEQT